MEPTLKWLVGQQERRGEERDVCHFILNYYPPLPSKALLPNSPDGEGNMLCFSKKAVQLKIYMTLDKYLKSLYDRYSIERAMFPDISIYTHFLIMHTYALLFTFFFNELPAHIRASVTSLTTLLRAEKLQGNLRP